MAWQMHARHVPAPQPEQSSPQPFVSLPAQSQHCQRFPALEHVCQQLTSLEVPQTNWSCLRHWVSDRLVSQ